MWESKLRFEVMPIYMPLTLPNAYQLDCVHVCPSPKRGMH